MFGYIKPHKSELKIKEYEMYKGIYCSLCKQLGKSYGFFSRFLLNYDFTFLAICLLASQKTESQFIKSHCSFCYSKKCVCCKLPNSVLDYCAAISLIVAYYKIEDNFKDGSIFEKILCGIALPYMKHTSKKASKRYPEVADYIKTQLDIQENIEKNNPTSVDMASDSTAKALGNIFSFMYDVSQKKIAYRFGYCLGRFIYICDALDDLEKDIKSGNYNPFLMENKNPDFKKIRNSSLNILYTTADELAKAYELIDFHRYKSILDNIVYYGLDDSIYKVLRKDREADE